MPRNGNTAEQPKTNSEGKLYPWMLEGKDFASYRSLFLYSLIMPEPLGAINKTEESTQLTEKMIGQSVVGGNKTTVEEASQILGGYESSERGAIQFGIGQAYTGHMYYTPEQKKGAMENYAKMRKMQEETSKSIRSKYAGKSDADSRRLNERSERYAQMLDLCSEVYNPEAGNIMKAEMDAPYLGVLNLVINAAPKFGDSKDYEKNINIMDQKDVPNGKSIYDDYMNVMDSGMRETKVQYHRQEMEKTGWDAAKEKTYLNELRREHQKTIEAFDNLWALDDKGQYDDALNNKLDHTVGKQLESKRDINSAVGYMRGEVRAIDLGYDSKHLHVLGQLGMQEQIMKKEQSEITLELQANAKKLEDLKDRDLTPERKELLKNKLLQSQEELKQRQELLDEYKLDFDKFNEDFQNRKVNSKEEMENAGAEVSAFFEAHQEKYADLQKMQGFYKLMIDHNKELGAKADPVPTPRLTNADMNAFMIIQDGIRNLGGEENFPGMIDKVMQTFVMGSYNYDKENDSPTKGQLNEDYDKEVKSLASEIVDKIDAYEESRQKDPAHPLGEALRSGFADSMKVEAESARDGIHVVGDPKNAREMAFWGVETLMPQLNPDILKPENADQLESALKEYPLDKFVKMGNELQRMRNEFGKKEAGMSQAEKDAFRQEMLDKKQDMLELATDLREKSAHPSPQVRSLFGKDDGYLTRDDYGFIGKRGLRGLTEAYGADLGKTDIPDKQIDAFDKSLEKFNTKRSGIFRSESDEHKEMRETAEKVQKNLKVLKSGMIQDVTGNLRPLTAEEKQDLMVSTIDDLNTLSSKADTYISHSTKNGTRSPGTGAGEDRLNGARELKDLTNELQEALMKEQQFEAKRLSQREIKKSEAAVKKESEVKQSAPEVKEQEVKQSAPEEKKTADQKEDRHHKLDKNELKDFLSSGSGRERRNSLRDPNRRPSLERTGTRKDVLDNNKSIQPRRSR